MDGLLRAELLELLVQHAGLCARPLPQARWRAGRGGRDGRVGRETSITCSKKYAARACSCSSVISTTGGLLVLGLSTRPTASPSGDGRRCIAHALPCHRSNSNMHKLCRQGSKRVGATRVLLHHRRAVHLVVCALPPPHQLRGSHHRSSRLHCQGLQPLDDPTLSARIFVC